MKIGVMSDSHDQVENILKAVDIFNQEQVELVIHCGDWVSPFTIKFYKKIKCPIRGVFGNNDGDRFLHLARAKNYGIDLTYEERELILDLDGRHIYVHHGDYSELINSAVRSGEFDAVFHGHTHIRANEKVGKTLSLNPGSLMKFTSDDAQGASIAIYDTTTNTARHIDL